MRRAQSGDPDRRMRDRLVRGDDAGADGQTDVVDTGVRGLTATSPSGFPPNRIFTRGATGVHPPPEAA